MKADARLENDSSSKKTTFMEIINDYLILCKAKVVALLIFSALVGMLLAVEGQLPPLDLMFFATIGIGFASASGAALNQCIEYEEDVKMGRTKDRPVAADKIKLQHAISFAIVLMGISMLVLVLFVNLLTAILTLFALVGYAIIYTAYLKKATPQNIVIGGIAGAAPPVLGWCAMTGEVHPHALLLTLIIFVWTPPHFWPLAIAKREEYRAIGMPMLPVTHGVEFTRLQILLYTILLSVVTLFPYLTGMSHLIYLFLIIPLNALFFYFVFLMMKLKDDKTAMKTFVYSINYLMILFAGLLVDHYIPIK